MKKAAGNYTILNLPCVVVLDIKFVNFFFQNLHQKITTNKNYADPLQVHTL